MPGSDTALYSPLFGDVLRRTSFGLWLLQRISAVLLGPLVLVHVVVPDAARIPWISALLLVCVLAHGVSGFWRLAAARGVPTAISRALRAAGLIIAVGLGVLGIMIIISVV